MSQARSLSRLSCISSEAGHDLSQPGGSRTILGVARAPRCHRYALLAALCALRSQEITDNLVELLIGIVHKIGVKAEHKVEQELIEDFKRVTGKTNILFHVAEASLDHPDERVRDIIYPAAGGEQTLRDLVHEYKANGQA